MQIVRDLGGYTMGRSDLVRRAMSKKKQAVMEKERANFIYGNPEENVPGCISKGISEQVASGIYDDMLDFAKYAFNKAHAACYAVVAVQTAYLKYYYPVEFMAALMTSVIDFPKKVSEYILTCRSMGIAILPPDVNEGQAYFSVCGEKRSRYALTAIKSIGRPVVDVILEERQARGAFTSLNDFITRVADKNINKHAIENLIKSGALDSLGGTRKQFMSVYVQILDHVTRDKKSNLAGQMSLFDIVEDSGKAEFDFRMPELEEYSKEMLLAFEKEVLGFYLSGHPLEEYQELWSKYVTNNTNDFALDEEMGSPRLKDEVNVVVGGLIADKKVKYTKNDKVMAFLNLEDLVGNVEVVVFPRDYEKYGSILMEDAKVFIRGRASVEEDKDGKLICEEIVTFEEAAKLNGEALFKNRYVRRGGGNGSLGYSNGGYGNAGYSNAGNGSGGYGNAGGSRQASSARPQPRKIPNGIWIQFPDEDGYREREQELLAAIADSDGDDDVVIFLRNTKAYKVLAPNLRVRADDELREKLSGMFGGENVNIKM